VSSIQDRNVGKVSSGEISSSSDLNGSDLLLPSESDVRDERSSVELGLEGRLESLKPLVVSGVVAHEVGFSSAGKGKRRTRKEEREREKSARFGSSRGSEVLQIDLLDEDSDSRGEKIRDQGCAVMHTVS